LRRKVEPHELPVPRESLYLFGLLLFEQCDSILLNLLLKGKLIPVFLLLLVSGISHLVLFGLLVDQVVLLARHHFLFLN
jgi:hypothetical protein